MRYRVMDWKIEEVHSLLRVDLKCSCCVAEPVWIGEMMRVVGVEQRVVVQIDNLVPGQKHMMAVVVGFGEHKMELAKKFCAK